MHKLTEGAVRCKVDFQAGERQCVKRPAGFTADGRADRFSSRFDLISSLLGDFESMRMISKLPENHPYG